MKRIWNWFRLGELENGLDRELKYHLDRRVDDLVRSGLSETEARKRAGWEIGGRASVEEEVRDIWLTRWMRDFVHDLRFSLRSFRRNPSFTATATLSLALGIGATTAIYSLLDQVVRRALPVKDAESLVLIDWTGEQAQIDAFGSYNLMSYPVCGDLNRQTRFFEGVFCRALTTISFSTGSQARPVAAELVSGSYFSLLGAGPSVGRVLTPEDDRPPAESAVAVLSHDFWRTAFAADPEVVGRKIMVNQYPVTIVGVGSPRFRGIDVGAVPSLWLPASMAPRALPGFKMEKVLHRRVKWMQILGRLRQGVSLEQAQTGLQPWFHAMRDEDTRLPGFPKLSVEQRQAYYASALEITAAPQGHSVLRRRLTQPLWILFAATMVLLALACLNVAGLFLARGSARHREVTTRLALGASRFRIGRQLFADSILIAVTGGVLGVALAPVAMRALLAFLPTDVAGNSLETGADTRVLLFACLVTVLTGLLTGFTPALQAGRGPLITALKERAGSASTSIRLRRVIVTAQIAFTLVLVVGAALFVRSLTALLAKGPGFDTQSLVSFGVHPRRGGYDPGQSARLVTRLRNELDASGIARATALARIQLLMGGSWNYFVTIQSDRRIVTQRSVNLNAVTRGFFSTLGARFVAGSGFEERDSLPPAQGGRLVVIVNETFVKRYLGAKNPIGLRVAVGNGPDVVPDAEIIGVTSDISYRGVREEWEQLYFPLRTDSSFTEGAHFYVRLNGNSAAGAQSVREIVRRVDSALPISYLRTVDEQVSRSLDLERMLAAISSSFGSVALLLSLVGLYGVMAFLVTQRTREIGIRMALGATRPAAVWLVLRDALFMIGAGIAIALPCVWVLGRLIESQLYGVKASDPATIGLAALVLGAAALGSALLPAKRASAVNPTEALRFE